MARNFIQHFRDFFYHLGHCASKKHAFLGEQKKADYPRDGAEGAGDIKKDGISRLRDWRSGVREGRRFLYKMKDCYNKSMPVTIFTDGSSRGNPGPGGWGAIVLTPDVAFELGGREEKTTNNRMELMAVICALESIQNEREILLYTDSAYVLNGATRWVNGWMRNDWKTSTKEDVVNRDLWERLVEAVAHKVIDWKLIKGHAGNPGNERCDVIATSFADNNPVILYNGARSRYGIDISISALPPAKKPKSKSAAYSYVSMVDRKIEVHKTWEECKKRVHGVNAKFKKSISPKDEEDIIREFSE